MPAKLTHIKVKLVDYDKCLLMVRRQTPDMLCASNRLSDASPCAGDSGAPMMHNHTIYGLASYFTACGHVGMASIYTDVLFHIDWIHRILKSGAQCPCPLYVFIIYSSTYTFFHLLL